MTVLQSQIRINAPQEHVWEVLADLGAIANFHPYITNAYYTSERLEGSGASRVCEFFNGLAIEETAVDWREGESYTLKIDFLRGRTPPISKMLGSFGLRMEGNHTIATMRIDYDMKFGPLGAALDKLMIQRQYAKLLGGVLEGLKHHAETGERVDPNVLKRIQAAPVAA